MEFSPDLLDDLDEVRITFGCDLFRDPKTRVPILVTHVFRFSYGRDLDDAFDRITAAGQTLEDDDKRAKAIAKEEREVYGEFILRIENYPGAADLKDAAAIQAFLDGAILPPGIKPAKVRLWKTILAKQRSQAINFYYSASRASFRVNAPAATDGDEAPEAGDVRGDAGEAAGAAGGMP